MKIEIKSAYISDANGETNIRIWRPAESDFFSGYLVLTIGEKGKKGGIKFGKEIPRKWQGQGLAQFPQ